MTLTSSARLILLCCLGLLVMTDPAAAREGSIPSLAQAKRAYKRGAALYQAGDFLGARDAFQKAYDLSHLPDLLYNLARVAENLGQFEEAVSYLERYLRESPDVKDRAEIEAEINLLRQKVPLRKAQQAPAAIQPVPPLRTSWRERWLPPWPQLALCSGGLAFLIVGAGLGGGAIAAAREIEGLSRFDMSLDSRGKSLNNAAIAFDVIGALALSAGAAWSVVWIYRRHRAAGQAGRVGLAPQGAGLLLLGSF